MICEIIMGPAVIATARTPSQSLSMHSPVVVVIDSTTSYHSLCVTWRIPVGGCCKVPRTRILGDACSRAADSCTSLRFNSTHTLSSVRYVCVCSRCPFLTRISSDLWLLFSVIHSRVWLTHTHTHIHTYTCEYASCALCYLRSTRFHAYMNGDFIHLLLIDNSNNNNNDYHRLQTPTNTVNGTHADMKSYGSKLKCPVE
ncbi:hypothetical protein EJ05DRAFT_241385 [Pseudovirgaria hyperparasitica]|uniref:Uncharacterized protein n=1 Tax=Pseudovirgaria hyperparasitica TaxID=470096 RepID=A0A6A6WF14_9PEZI|nr:uncharacterized protein EJ05DRAFT_241385 [Pseudovirgaria hyperparasitica]KAF2760749.1 hypothetical protein EJ05DRAFT_241385 [Pseudovirgaria hyperparasitica]